MQGFAGYHLEVGDNGNEKKRKMEMRKLFVLAALALACAGANAASVDWAVKGTVDNVGNKVYLVGALSDSWTSVADIAAAAAAFGIGTSGEIAKNGRVYSVGSKTLASDSVTKTSGDVYFIIVSGDDATSYNYVKADLKGLAYEGSDSSPGSFDTTADALHAGTSVAFVPEPTSGLLMLVGFAGLALRRRRA